MNNELVQLVMQLYEKNWGVRDYWLARAVVALCMEEAAKITDEIGDEWYYENGQYHCKASAAIRALKDKA